MINQIKHRDPASVSATDLMLVASSALYDWEAASVDDQPLELLAHRLKARVSQKHVDFVRR